AAPGQRYFAPVTLSLMAGAQAYGLQFNVSLEPLSAPASSDYHMAFDSMLVERLPGDTNRVIPPAVYVLAGTNFVTNFVAEIQTNFTYQVTLTNLTPVPNTNYVVFTNKLPDTVPFITTKFVENLGQFYPISVTNYVTNSFQLVSQGNITNTTSAIETKFLY